MKIGALSRALWLVFGLAIVGLGWQFQNRLEMMFIGRGTLTVTEANGEVVLNWRGSVEAPMRRKLQEAFETYGAGNPRFVISLTSPGGSLQHGAEVIRLIRREQQTHAVDTIVEGRNICASMCVPIYLAGQQRSASPSARFMFHEVQFRDAATDKIDKVPARAIAQATDSFFARYFLPAGVDPAWVADMREKVRGRDVWRRADQLVEERAGIVKRLE